MALSEDQRDFFADNGYLPYGRVLDDAEVEGLRQRSEEIARGRVEHVPPRFNGQFSVLDQSSVADSDCVVRPLAI